MLLVVETVAVCFSLLCVLFTIKKSIWLWPAGIVGVIAYMFLFFSEKLYADTFLQVIFLLQSIYGWYYWGKENNIEAMNEIKSLSNTHFILALISIIATTIGAYLYLIKFTDASSPYWDSLATSFSLMATWLLGRRFIENWICWIMADIVYVGLFFYKGLYISSALYSLFLVLSIAGLIRWKKELSAIKASY